MSAAALLLATVLSQSYYTPTEAQALFSQANEAYSREDYASARSDYEKLLAHGYGGADVLYNLGTTALAQGDVGHAVLALERAERAGGRSDDVEAQLALARSRQLDKVVGSMAEDDFLPRLVAATDGRAVSIIFLSAWLLGFALIALYRGVRPRSRTAVALAAAVVLLAAVPAGLLLAAHAWVHHGVREAVVLAPTLQARVLPQPQARVAFEVHAGLKVRLLQRAGSYVQLRLPNGLEGWAPVDGVEAL
ncbi:SH3 domain-containing protein [Aggregicoccus sp. 17bor-14]|uniref:tetratricopeptide repeat protein n=1 Tax=Myxococcaceae TaxID=31 RepID=UPI00129CAEE1|nr:MULTISPECIES: tetratricopeptide repeat protein [Myxococcaceae]MBF5044362.1 SH3 domain-containing protein [Simulacricoccus sp. 17bor-14]MRI90109.1 SH3 domain-containing protein [Aggregicoccus sp. 17bor-14]